jgi:non-specific serine/threonine protein kinase
VTSAGSPLCYRFGRFELQPAERRLLGVDGSAAQVGPHAFDLLLALVERAGHLLSKEELLAQVWRDVVVEANTLQVHISALRKVLGAEAIATVSGRGYRFALEVSSHATEATAHNLPHPITRFIGRRRELAELRHLMDTTRLLTLTGAGGCGKTRLALELARQVFARFGDGVYLVELAALANPALTPHAVAQALNVKEPADGDMASAIAARIGSQRILLVLDNAEHVLDACAQLADTLLRRCGHLSLLVTSREHLAITGEQSYRVPSLPEAEALELFIDRARLQNAGFGLVDTEASAAATVCRRLDGIALAIELAAARVRSMSVDELRRGLDDRFGMLATGSRTALPRHRTLRSLIDWSYDQLSEAEQALMQRTSVFSGGWTPQTAEQVCCSDAVKASDLPALLRSLVDKNLVHHEAQGTGRYGVLETVRDYALGHLRTSGREAVCRARHLACFAALAKETEQNTIAPDADAVRRVMADRDNIRAALVHASTPGGDVAAGLQMATAMSSLWMLRGDFAEGRAALATLLASAPSDLEPVTRLRALRAASRLAWAQSDHPVAQARCEEALAISEEIGDRRESAVTLAGLGAIASQLGDSRTAKAHYREALAIRRELGDPKGILDVMINLGNATTNAGDPAAGRAMLEDALALGRSSRLPVDRVLYSLGVAASNQRDFAAARPWLEEYLRIQRELALPAGLFAALSAIGALDDNEGRTVEAAAHLQEALRIEKAMRRPHSTWSILQSLGGPLFALGACALAVRLFAGAAQVREDLGEEQLAVVRDWANARLLEARTALGDAAFEREWDQGRAMPLDELIESALAFTPG